MYIIIQKSKLTNKSILTYKSKCYLYLILYTCRKWFPLTNSIAIRQDTADMGLLSGKKVQLQA